MNAPLRIEMASFWFGPSPSGKVALLSCALAGESGHFDGCVAEPLARQALSKHGGPYERLRWLASKDSASAPWGALSHRQLFVEGSESFGLFAGFMDGFVSAALASGLRAEPCQPYWAAFEATPDPAGWPAGQTRAWIERALLRHGVDGPQEDQDSQGRSGRERARL